VLDELSAAVIGDIGGYSAIFALSGLLALGWAVVWLNRYWSLGTWLLSLGCEPHWRLTRWFLRWGWQPLGPLA
jgi:hypothetical protein